MKSAILFALTLGALASIAPAEAATVSVRLGACQQISSGSGDISSHGYVTNLASTSFTALCPIHLPTGAQITSYTVNYFDKTTSGDPKISTAIYYAASSELASIIDDDDSATTLTCNMTARSTFGSGSCAPSGFTHTVDSNYAYWVYVAVPSFSTASQYRVGTVTVTYTP